VLVFVPVDGAPADVLVDSFTGGAFPVYGDWGYGKVAELYAAEGADAVRALSIDDSRPITGIAWIGTVELGTSELFRFTLVPWYGPNSFALHADFYAHDVFADRLWSGDLNVGWAEPVTWSFIAQMDTYITRLAPDTSFGDAHILNVRQPNSAHTLIQFATGTIPYFANIQSATLTIYPTVRSNESPLELSIFPVESPWEASDVTWNTAPAVGGEAAAMTTVANTLDPVVVDVTALVKLWQANPEFNFGAMLSGVGADRVVYSFMASENGSYPALDVTFQ